VTMSSSLFLIALFAAGLGGYAALIRLGFDDFDAWAGGRVAGLVLIAFPAWWLGVLGLSGWRVVGAVVLLASASVGGWTVWRRRRAWRQLVAAEAIFVVASLVVALIRLDHPQIAGQEKLMDVGILATLLRSEGFPPLDMWLAGETLPYYYWGALLWTVPLVIGGLRLEVAYNLIVAMVGGQAAVIMWALGRRLAGSSHFAGATAAFFGVLAGTPDGWRQLLGGRSIRSLDVWRSSRQHEDVITEWPLFTEWLGDLHPHYLSIPVAALGFLVAWRAGRDGPKIWSTVALAVLFGVAWAANPWCMPPTLAGIALLLLCGDGRWHWPTADGMQRWLAVIVVAVGGWLAVAPFHLSFHPPFQGVRKVFAWTEPATLLLYGGCLVVPVFLAVVVLLRDRFGEPEVRARALTLATGAVLMMTAAASGRPTLVMLGAAILILVLTVLEDGERAGRPALALAALGVFLFAVPEVVYVVDSYGDRLHRMNTVFKAYIQAWVLLAAALPALLRLAVPAKVPRRILTALLVVAALPHPVWMVLNQTSGGPLGLDGMAWMERGDRGVVGFLRDQPGGTTMIEAVGGAYTEYARFSANSGVPAYLGWANHELVWRGHGVVEETNRRSELVRELYSCGDTDRVRDLVSESGTDLVTIGAFERRDFPAASLAAVRSAGTVVHDEEGGVVVRFDGGMEDGDG